MFSLYKNKRVLVIGHTGFKGTWLSEWLLNLGADVSGYSLYLPSEPNHFTLLKHDQRTNHHEGDIRDLPQLQQVLTKVAPEIVFHLAAQPIVSRSISDPVETFHTNVLGTTHVLEALRNTSSVKSAVIITSDKCYENVEWEYGYRENDHLGGKDPYSASKAAAEAVFHSYFRTYFAGDSARIRLATARAGNVIGGGDWAKDRLIPDCVRAWGQDQAPEIRSPFATRPWQHVLEPLSGYLALGCLLYQNAEGVNGESFNFGPGAEVNHTVAQVLDECHNHWQNANYSTIPNPLNQKECGLLKLNCDKALHRLAWLPSLRFEETIGFTMNWYKNFYAGSYNADYTRQQIREYTTLAQERGRTWSL